MREISIFTRSLVIRKQENHDALGGERLCEIFQSLLDLLLSVKQCNTENNHTLAKKS